VNQQMVILVVVVVAMGALMFWQQRQARRRREKLLAGLSVGDEVVTIGGIIGKLTHLDSEEGRACIEIAPSVEVWVVLAAIGHTLT